MDEKHTGNQPARGNTPEQEKAIRILQDWYERDKVARSFYVDEMREIYKLYKGDHWDLIGPGGVTLRSPEHQKNRPNCVENMVFSMIESTASEFAQDIELIDYPVEPSDDEAAKTMTELKKFIMRKNKVDSERVKLLRWFFLYGTGIKHPYWDPDWQGGRGPNRWHGDIRWRALHPMCLVPDARCKEDINEGNRCHKVIWHTMESVREKYPERADYVQDEIMDIDDLLDQDQDTGDEGLGTSEYLQEQVPVIETWYIGKPLILEGDEKDEGTGLHVIWWAGEDQGVFLRHTNYVYYDPGESPKFPFITKVCYPREGSIWGFGEAYFLKSPQIVMNKTAEIILEGHLHGAIGQTWYEENALTDKQRKVVQEKGTLPGMWFAAKNILGIKREYGKPVPHTLSGEMVRLSKVMEAIIGRPDISQGRTPGGVTAFKAIAELSARAQVRLRIKEMAITGLYEETGSYTNRLIWKFYTQERKFRIMGKEGYEYKQYRQEDMLRIYDTETGDILPYQDDLAAEVEGMEGDRYEVYFPEFDVFAKVTAVVPADRFYNMEMAKELLMGQIIDPETFIHVMEHGKFPPWEEVTRRIQGRQMMAQQPGVPGVPGMPQQGIPQDMPAEPDVSEEQLAQVISMLPIEAQEYLASVPPEQQLAVLDEMLGGMMQQQ